MIHLLYNSFALDLNQFKLKQRPWWNIVITVMVYKQQSLGSPHIFPCISSCLLSLVPEIETFVFPTFGWSTSTNLVAQKVDKNPTFHLGKWNLDRGNGQIAEMICVWSFLYFFLHCVATTASGNDILVLRIFFNLYKGDCFPTEETEKREQKWNHPTLLLTLNKG